MDAEFIVFLHAEDAIDRFIDGKSSATALRRALRADATRSPAEIEKTMGEARRDRQRVRDGFDAHWDGP